MTSDGGRERPREALNKPRLTRALLAAPAYFALFMVLPAGDWAWLRGWIFKFCPTVPRQFAFDQHEQIFNGDEFCYNIFEYPGVLVTPFHGFNGMELPMRPRSLLPLILLVLAPVAHAGDQEKTLFTEPFAEKLADGWTWLREDPKGWRLDKGTLIVRTAMGGLWMKDNGGSNILLRTPPRVKDGKLAVEVLVDIQPTNAFENAGLIWYYDDDNYVIMVKEKIGDDVHMQLVAEQDGKLKAGFHKKHKNEKPVWVRMEVEGDKISGSYRMSAKDEWITVGQCGLPVRGEAKVGLTTAYAPKTPEHFTRFREFRMLQVK